MNMVKAINANFVCMLFTFCLISILDKVDLSQIEQDKNIRFHNFVSTHMPAIAFSILLCFHPYLFG